jgi:membrane-bound lytic murein transglycosylase D
MKTMLKRKLYRTALLGYCLLFITTKNPAQDIQLNDTTYNQTAAIMPEEPVITNVPAIGLNKKAVLYVKTYLKENNSTLVMVKNKSAYYFTIIDSVFTKYDLPVQLKYMAVVESNLKTSARSHVGAAGLWQLMPATARIFGLRTTKKHDERFHVYKSTIAAARYMKDLYTEFDDWLLAIAAYNAGPGRVHYAIRQSGSHNFWRLQYFLPAETRNYVKRFIGVHYYFEGQGSVTTLTKTEAQQYKKTVAEFIAKNSETNEIKNEIVNDVANER